MTQGKILPKTDRPSMQRWISALNRTGYDKDYRERFIADPRAMMQAEGFDIPADIELVVIQDEPRKLHFVLPTFDDRPIFLEEDDPLLAEIDAQK